MNTHEEAVESRKKANLDTLRSTVARLRRVSKKFGWTEAELSEKIEKETARKELHQHWDEDHWPGINWPEDCLRAEVMFGHPGYRFQPLVWTKVVVTLKTGSTRAGTIAQVFGKWIFCIVQLEPNVKPGCYPFRCDKVQPWDKNPIAWSGERRQSHLEVVDKEEQKDVGKDKTKSKSKKKTKNKKHQILSRITISLNNMEPKVLADIGTNKPKPTSSSWLHSINRAMHLCQRRFLL